MPKDPIVEEIRKIREEYASQFNYDLEAIARDLKEKEKESIKQGRKLVSFSDTNKQSHISQKTKKRRKAKS